MSEVVDRSGKLNALWEGCLKPLADPALYEKDRVLAAFEVMRTCCSLRDKNEDQDTKLSCLSHATMCLQLIAADMFSPTDKLHPAQNFQEGLEERWQILMALAVTENSLMPWLRDAADPALVLMPLSTLRVLQRGFDALASGEVQDIFRPAGTGRHGAAWSLDQSKRRAVQHVLFLDGQGVKKRLARQRVAVVTGVSPETLRKWEERDLDDPLDTFGLAKAAGKLCADLTVDPSAWSMTQSVDARVAETFESLRTETLAEFGRRYRTLEADGGKRT